MKTKKLLYSKTKEILFSENNLSYYFLGAFITDGNVIKDKSRTNSFKCSLSSKDKDWLEIINHNLNNEGKLREDKPLSKGCYSLWFYNKDIYDWLVSHECTPNKSLTAKLPNIPEHLFKDFIRGCLDGDGCISIGQYKSSKNKKLYKQISTYICGASYDLLYPMSKKLTDMGFQHSFITRSPTNNKIDNRIIIGKNTIYRIQFSGYKRASKFLKWLYTDTFIAMPRKENMAKLIINWQKPEKSNPRPD